MEKRMSLASGLTVDRRSSEGIGKQRAGGAISEIIKVLGNWFVSQAFPGLETGMATIDTKEKTSNSRGSMAGI